MYLSFYQKSISLKKNNWFLNPGVTVHPVKWSYSSECALKRLLRRRIQEEGAMPPSPPIKNAWICTCFVGASDWCFDNLRWKSKSERLRWWLPHQDYSSPDDQNPKSTLSEYVRGEWLLGHFWINLVQRKFISSQFPLGGRGMIRGIYFIFKRVLKTCKYNSVNQ